MFVKVIARNAVTFFSEAPCTRRPERGITPTLAVDSMLTGAPWAELHSAPR